MAPFGTAHPLRGELGEQRTVVATVIGGAGDDKPSIHDRRRGHLQLLVGGRAVEHLRQLTRGLGAKLVLDNPGD